MTHDLKFVDMAANLASDFYFFDLFGDLKIDFSTSLSPNVGINDIKVTI